MYNYVQLTVPQHCIISTYPSYANPDRDISSRHESRHVLFRLLIFFLWLPSRFLCPTISDTVRNNYPVLFNIFTARKRSLRRLCFYRCLSFCPQGGACVVAWGGVCGCSGGMGACVVAPRGCAWFYSGGHAWFYSGGMHGFIRGHAWFYLGGVHGFIQGGVHGFIWGGMRGFIRGGRAWFFRIQWDTVNERAVCILLECILVLNMIGIPEIPTSRPAKTRLKYFGNATVFSI